MIYRESKDSIKCTKRIRFTAAACAVLLTFSIIISACSDKKEDTDNKDASDKPAYGVQNRDPGPLYKECEIKNVSRDVTTGRFADNSGDDIEYSSALLTGYEILQDEAVNEEIQNAWDEIRNDSYHIKNMSDAVYSLSYSHGTTSFETVLYKYADAESKDPDWSIKFNHIMVNCIDISPDGHIFLYGISYVDDYGLVSSSGSGWIAHMTDVGDVIWQKNTGDRFADITLLSGSAFMLFSYSISQITGTSTLCITEYDYYGELINETVTDICENMIEEVHIENDVYYQLHTDDIRSAAKLKDGYMVSFSSSKYGERAVKINSEGNITDTFIYTSDDYMYSIRDMIEYNGSIYISAYALPFHEDIPHHNGWYDETLFLWHLQEDSFDDEITAYMRDNYSAVLFICDPDSGAPKEFYTAAGSMGSSLSINDDGYLIWDVETILSARRAPIMSSVFIDAYGSCNIYRYAFDETGILGQNKSETVQTFTR